MDKISFWILILFLAYFTGWLIWNTWKKIQEKSKQGKMLDETVDEPTLNVVGATVTAKTVADEVSGNPKFPQRRMVFAVTFTTDSGEEMVLEVSREVFDTLNDGDSGALALHNETYYDFLKGESLHQQQEEESVEEQQTDDAQNQE